MSKKYSRKDFLRTGSLAAAGLLFGACGNDPVEKKEELIKETPFDTLATSDPVAENFDVDIMEKEGNKRYEGFRAGFNKRFDKYPLAIALPTTTAEVAEAVRYARHHNYPIAIRSGGHSMEAFSSNDDGLMINLSEMNSVEFLDDNKIKVGPGCTLSNLYDHILPKGRIIPAGSCGSVGVGGLTTGGGYGLFSREFGLTCDHLVEATMVDGNGKIISSKDDAELLWALRGGGSGNFGIVTEMVFRSHEAPANMISHHFKARKLDPDRATAILEKWMLLTQQLPHSCFSAYVLNGGTLNILLTNFAGEDNEGVESFIEGLKGETDEYKKGVRLELAKKLKNYYGSKVPLNFRNSSAGFYKDFDHISGCIGKVLKSIIDNRGMIFQVNTLGGKVKDQLFANDSCFPHREYDFISEIQAYWTEDYKEMGLQQVTHDCLELLKANNINAQYFNYCSAEFTDWQTAYYGKNYEHLREIKRRYDKDNFIRHPQSIEL
ncbi:MAG: FAD-binding oxidoreductase [Sphingobacteriaceae bacterium]|nr:FAD-binding oxidoreductase [Sphingobacteriaceae bacterium]